MFARTRLGLAVAAVAALSGCGTIQSNAYLSSAEGGGRVYGGVCHDCETIQTERFAWARIFAQADVPFSAVGDTLTLPYTLSVAVLREVQADDAPAP